MFQSVVLEFKNNKLIINFNIDYYEKLKEVTLKNYNYLAKQYALKIDAKEFLNRFCIL